MRISEWSSDVCSSDLEVVALRFGFGELNGIIGVGTFFPTSRSVPAFRHYLSRFVEMAMKIVLAARFDPAASTQRDRGGDRKRYTQDFHGVLLHRPKDGSVGSTARNRAKRSEERR